MTPLFRSAVRIGLIESGARPVPVGPMKKIMMGFKSPEEFLSKNLAGYGAVSADGIAHLIDVASRTHLDLTKVRSSVRENGVWYFLHKVPVSTLDLGAHGEVEPTGKEDLSKPIVVGQRGIVLDGRHRVMMAKAQGVAVLPAFIPANVLYNMLTATAESVQVGRKTLFTSTQRQTLREASLNLDRVKADIMSDDPLTYSAYAQDDLHGSLKDRIEEIVYNHAYETAQAGRNQEKDRHALDALFSIAKKEKFLPVIEKAWRDGLKDGGA